MGVSTKTVDTVYQYLKVCGNMGATSGDVQQRYRYSKTTVYEALKRLEKCGLIEKIHGLRRTTSGQFTLSDVYRLSEPKQ